MKREYRRIVAFLLWCAFLFILSAPAWAAVGLAMILAYLATPERPE